MSGKSVTSKTCVDYAETLQAAIKATEALQPEEPGLDNLLATLRDELAEAKGGRTRMRQGSYGFHRYVEFDKSSPAISRFESAVMAAEHFVRRHLVDERH